MELDPIEKQSFTETGDIGDDRDVSKLEIVVVPIDQEETNLIHTNVQSAGENKQDEKKVQVHSCTFTLMLSLAVFGIVGVLPRHVFGELTGPDAIYLELPSNMVGSFLMGIIGVVFKDDIMIISEELAIGLSTGFLGSLTTFSGWIQKILELCVEGRWVFAVLGVILGLFLNAYSIIFGIDRGKGLKWLLRRSNIKSSTWVSNKFQFHIIFTVSLLLTLGVLWGLFVSLEMKEFKYGNSEAVLFLACMLAPFGVWIRWFLARFNGRGLGQSAKLKWIPFGTLAANVLAVCVMASLAILKKEVKSSTFNTVASGIQFGLLGCLSTVSTVMAEFHAMRENPHPWRAYVYALITFVLSLGSGTLIYSVPMWAKS